MARYFALGAPRDEFHFNVPGRSDKLITRIAVMSQVL
jgi:hypothetical protein